MHTVDLIFKRTFIPNFRMEKVCAGSWVEAVGKSSDTLRGNIIELYTNSLAQLDSGELARRVMI